MKHQTENTRISGTAINTVVSQLPERFAMGPHTKAMASYLSRRWHAQSYGWYKRVGASVSYNSEYSPTDNPRNSDRYRWVEHPSDGLRFVGKADEVRGSGDGNLPYFDRSLVDHNGWYMNSFQDELAWGEVYQLPSRNGESLYVPAICTSNDDRDGNDGAILDFHSITGDLKEAIRWSDSMAESYAGHEREYQARESAKSRIEEINEEIKTAYADFKGLAKELRANCDKLTGMDRLRAMIKAEYRRMRRELHGLRVEKSKLEDNYWYVTG